MDHYSHLPTETGIEQADNEQAGIEETGIEETGIEQAIDLLDRALTLLDSEHLLIAAAKVDDARNTLLGVSDGVACLATG